ncbi:autophagy-related protein 16-1 isoform X2 [Coccinella septempunctata]|uniref:autophagy-related protein 16-1 isoform X2 n=1 Tax=Coccinella septempunctata TaxID=41139 RepID=UPI001D08EEA4|nr:autophagy-related protein 16-1 isoform X2 [Coccinella septempunctata]
MATDNWKESIKSQLQLRNKVEAHKFQDIIAQNTKIFKYANALRVENNQLSSHIDRLKVSEGKGGGNDSRYQEKIQFLEQKLLTQQEELTELHRRKGENAQQIIDLTAKVQEQEKLLQTRDASIAEMTKERTSLKAEIGMYQKSLKELEYLIDTLRDEHSALQMAFNALEEKLRTTQDENRQLVERLIKYKTKDVDRLNEENDNFLSFQPSGWPPGADLEKTIDGSKKLLSTFGLFKRKKYLKVQKDIEDACRDTSRDSVEEISEAYNIPLQETMLPTKCVAKIDAHDGEVNAVKWSPADGMVATAGADRKVKLWDASKGHVVSKGMLVGSNAGVMSLDFDSTGSMILAASNDYASRVWTVSDMRLRHTLTGHSGKVMAAKFLGEASKVVTGSHDRTLKIWDLRSRACTETKFAGSSCNDLVTVDSSGSTIISGHFDKSIRFWDTRGEACSNSIIFNGKVTSLDLTRDAKYLLCCVRDDTLKLLDLRMNQIVNSFSCDGFKVGCDWARATFSPDGQYVSVGSSDGSVYLWGVNTAKVESILKEHVSAVTATAWQPYGTYLATVDRSKKLIVWGDQ